MKFSAARRLIYFIEQYGPDAGIEAWYADQGITTKGQASLDLSTEDEGETFLASLSTPITAVS